MTVQLELTEIKRAWLDHALDVFPLLFRAGRLISTDELHPLLPAPEHRNWYGVLFATLKQQGRIMRVSARASTRKEANGRLVSVWEVL